MSDTATRILLAKRPHGPPTAADFRVETAPLPVPADGLVLLRVLFLSLDPYMRGRMDDAKSYAPPTPLGAVMEGGTVAEVVESRHPGFAAGDKVLSHSGWQTHALSDGTDLCKLDPAAAPLSTALGVLGMPGFTAWSGLRNIGRPRAGETLVVAAASGPVGSAVGQIARIGGVRAVGVAGGEAKCRHVREELGFDACLDHRAPDFPAQLAATCPDGVDVYFENVGGAVWDAVFPLLNPFARVPVCGLVSQYNGAGHAEGARSAGAGNGASTPEMMLQVLRRSLLVRGFIQREFASQQPEFREEMAGWIRDGRVRYREDVVDGLENAPNAFIGLLHGRNFGKLLVRVA